MLLGSARLLISGPPISGESFFGYILRLTQWNSYDQASWILKRVGVAFNSLNGPKFKDSVNLMPLARLTGVDQDELAPLLYTGTEMRSKKRFFLGNIISLQRIRSWSPKHCPLCLVEADYHRQIWDLAYVTCCPAHKCFLVDTCPKCNKRMSWARNRVSVCGCGYDWRRVTPIKSSDEDLQLTRQVFKLCGISSGHFDEKANERNPLYSLELEDLLSAVTFMSAQYEMINDTSGRQSLHHSRTNKELNEFFSRGFAVFEEWPTRYYEFLSQRQTNSEKDYVTPRVSDVFCAFARTLVRSFSSEELRFMCIAFEQYLKEHWHSSAVAYSVLRFTGYDPNTKSYLSKNEAIKYLRTTLFWVDKLVEEGKLKITRRPGAMHVLSLFKRSELDEAKKYLTQIVNVKDVGKQLGISGARVLELAEYGCLMPLYQPDEAGSWLFSSNDVAQLLSRIRTKIIPPTTTTVRLLTLRGAIQRVCSQVKFGGLVRAILEDKLVPSGEVKGVGLNRFLLTEGQLIAYIRSQQPFAEDLFRPYQVAELFGVQAGSLYRCVKEGLLIAQPLPGKRSNVYRITITKEAINRFESTYVFCNKMIKGLVTSPRALVAILREQGIHPISGSGTDKKGAFIFRRADVEHLDLGELVRARKSLLDPRGTKYPTMTGEKVAELLEIDMPALRALVESNKLTPWREMPRANGDCPFYKFRRKDFQKYTVMVRKSQGLVSSSEAAAIMGVKCGSFNSRWGSGRLPATKLPYGLHTKYFQLKDVQRAKRLDQTTVGCLEAAKMLGIPAGSVAAKLSPVSGPKVDGHGWNRYLRSDVEKYVQKNGFSHRTRLIAASTNEL